MAALSSRGIASSQALLVLDASLSQVVSVHVLCCSWSRQERAGRPLQMGKPWLGSILSRMMIQKLQLKRCSIKDRESEDLGEIRFYLTAKTLP